MLWAAGPPSRVSSLMTALLRATHAEAVTKPQIALTNNPSLADAQWEIQTAQAGQQQTDLIPNPVLIIDAQAFRENSNTTNVKLRRTPKRCRKSHAWIEVASKSKGIVALESKHCRNDLRPDDRSFLRRHACTARSDFSSEFALSGGTMTSIRKRLNLVGASTPILFFGRKLKSISSEASRTYQSRDMHNVAEPRLRYEIHLALDKRSMAHREKKFFSQVILPAARSGKDSNTNFFEISNRKFTGVLGPPRTRIQYLASAQLLAFKDESSGSTATSLTWGATS